MVYLGMISKQNATDDNRESQLVNEAFTYLSEIRDTNLVEIADLKEFLMAVVRLTPASSATKSTSFGSLQDGKFVVG